MKLEYYIRITDGKPQNYLFGKLAKDFEGLKNGSYFLQVSPANKRSDNQNRYLHSLFTIFSTELINLTGDKMYTREVVKEICKAKFLKQDVPTPDGEILATIVRHTSELSKVEMVEFVENIIQWGAEQFGFQLPYPSEQLTLENK